MKWTFILLVCLIAYSAWAENIYKCYEDDGDIYYSEETCAGKGELFVVEEIQEATGPKIRPEIKSLDISIKILEMNIEEKRRKLERDFNRLDNDYKNIKQREQRYIIDWDESDYPDDEPEDAEDHNVPLAESNRAWMRGQFAKEKEVVFREKRLLIQKYQLDVNEIRQKIIRLEEEKIRLLSESLSAQETTE